MKMRRMIVAVIVFVSLNRAYVLKPYVIDDGGVRKATSSGFEVGVSVGQSFSGKVAAGNYVCYVGYWTPKICYPGIEELENQSYWGKPRVFALQQNYPNPVFSKTVIKYSIAKPCKVELKLFDATGRQIAVLVSEKQTPGYYQMNWNIQNVAEKQLANGVYFYRLEAGNYTSSRKMLIIR